MRYINKRDFAVFWNGWNPDGTCLFDIPDGMDLVLNGFGDEAGWDLRVTHDLRNMLLVTSDWRVLPDAPIPEEDQIAWKQWRQVLRDLPSDPNWPDVDFPMPPDADPNWTVPPNPVDG